MNRLPHSLRVTIALAATALGSAAVLGTRFATAPSSAVVSTVDGPATGIAGTFTGPVIGTQWGPVQVKVTLANGRVTEVTALRTPNSHRRSVAINQRATPILRQEALAAQSAQIDTVSGATVTSEAYAQSLQAALDAAHR
jgi:uncharacterized protein with FMN-binding domain